MSNLTITTVAVTDMVAQINAQMQVQRRVEPRHGPITGVHHGMRVGVSTLAHFLRAAGLDVQTSPRLAVVGPNRVPTTYLEDVVLRSLAQDYDEVRVIAGGDGYALDLNDIRLGVAMVRTIVRLHTPRTY